MNAAQRLKIVRKRLGMTQSKVASAVDIATMSYQRYERGERPIPPRLIYALQRMFGVNPWWIWDGVGNVMLHVGAVQKPHLRRINGAWVNTARSLNAHIRTEDLDAKQALRFEVVTRSHLAFVAGVRDPSLLDLLTMPGRPRPVAVLRAAGRTDLIAAIASHPTPAWPCVAAERQPEAAGASR